MTRSNRKARRTAASNPSSSGVSGPSSSSPGAQNSGQGGDSSSSGLVGAWDHLSATETLPLLSREMWLMVLDHLVPPPPTTTQERITRGTIVKTLVLVNKTWAQEVFRRKTRSVLINTDYRVVKRKPSYAQSWSERSLRLATKYGGPIRSLVVLKARALSTGDFKRFIIRFDQLYTLHIEDRSSLKGVLTGSTTLRTLRLAGADALAVSGVYPALAQLALRGRSGATLPLTLTRTNFPVLKTLALQLSRPDRKGPKMVDYTPGNIPPAVWNLSITTGTNFPFFPALLASENLEHLGLAVPVEALGTLLSHVNRSLVSLTLTVYSSGVDKDIQTRPDDAELALSAALAAPCLERLETLTIPRPSNTGAKWWFKVFAAKLNEQLKRRSVRLTIVHESAFDSFEWRAKNPVV
ncbi:hypothetical protein JCM10450v2_005850 [Rhodotorula kratochvilovae]